MALRRKRRSPSEHHPLTTTLDDGTAIVLRPVLPEDRSRIQAGLDLLSPRSLHTRFFGVVTRLSEQQLDYLSHVDQVGHVAWGAIIPTHPELPGVGIGRFIRLQDEPDVAEMAVTVIDAYQGSGVGIRLLAILYLLAPARGIRTLRAFVPPGRSKPARFLHELGARESIREGMARLDLPVQIDLSKLPATPRADRFRSVAVELERLLYRRE